MDVEGLGIIFCVLVAAALLIIYFVASYRERGQTPHYSQEVYLYYDPSVPTPDPASTAAAYQAVLATSAQIAIYAAAGGGAHGYGATAAGAFIGLTPTGIGGLAATAFPASGAPAVYGVWLYGAKPKRGSRGIVPFSCAHWFHPSGAAARP